MRSGDEPQGGGLRPGRGAEVQSLRICPSLKARSRARRSPVGSEDYMAPPPAAPLRTSHPEARMVGLLPGRLSQLREEPCLPGRDPITRYPAALPLDAGDGAERRGSRMSPPSPCAQFVGHHTSQLASWAGPGDGGTTLAGQTASVQYSSSWVLRGPTRLVG